MHSSDFCQFSKCSHFSNISCFLELLFAWNNFIVLLESLSVFFWILKFLTQSDHFPKAYSPCIVAIFANFQNGLIFRILAVFWSCFLHETTLLYF